MKPVVKLDRHHCLHQNTDRQHRVKCFLILDQTPEGKTKPNITVLFLLNHHKPAICAFHHVDTTNTGNSCVYIILLFPYFRLCPA